MRFILCLSCILLISLSAQLRAADVPTMPSGERWKNIAEPDTLIGTLLGYGTFLPISSQESFKIDMRDVSLRECNLVTLPTFPNGIWTGVKQYDFSKFNEGVNWLWANNMEILPHLLVGPNHYYPDWFKDGTFTNEELESMLEDYIRAIIQANDNEAKVAMWNVVNEALHGDKPDGATHYYRWCKWNQLGWEDDRSGLTGSDKIITQHPIWVRKAFEFARKYTDEKLEYRDNNIEFPNFRHYDAVYQLMRHYLNSGAPIDAIGFQTHMNIHTDYDWEGFKAQVERMHALGVEVYVTEADVRKATTSSEDREKQRQQYYSLVKSCREAKVEVIVFWGLRDGSVGQGDSEYALLFEDARASQGAGSFDAKPAYYGVQQALIETIPSDSTVPAAPTGLQIEPE